MGWDIRVQSFERGTRGSYTAKLELVNRELAVEKYVEFLYNILEDTEGSVARELIDDLQLPLELYTSIAGVLSQKIKPILKQRMELEVRKWLDKAKSFTKKKEFQRARQTYQVIWEYLQKKSQYFTNKTLDKLQRKETTRLSIRRHPSFSVSSFANSSGSNERSAASLQLNNPLQKEVILHLAHVHLKQRNLLESRNRFAQIIASERAQPDKTEIYLKAIRGLSKLYMIQEEHNKAKDVLITTLYSTRVTEVTQPELAKMYRKLSSRLREQQLLIEGVTLCNAMFSTFQETMRNSEELGQQLLNSSDIVAAQVAFKEATWCQRLSVTVLHELVDFNLLLEKYDNCLNSLKIILAFQSKLESSDHHSLIPILNRIGMVHTLLHQFKPAEACFNQSLEQADKSLTTLRHSLSSGAIQSQPELKKQAQQQMAQLNQLREETLINLLNLCSKFQPS